MPIDLEKARDYLLDMKRSLALSKSAPDGSKEQSDADVNIVARLKVVEQIGKELDEMNPTHFANRSLMGEWGWFNCQDSVTRLIGIIDTKAEADAIFAPSGPKLSASALHPWIWNAALDLWDKGEYRVAVTEAGRKLDIQLQTKLAKHDDSGASLVGNAFSLNGPTAATATKTAQPRLRFAHLVPGSERWKSAHEGAAAFGRGCMMGIRNWAVHDDTDIAEQEALEYLAALSVVARWIDSATLLEGS
ncbi:MAG: hypothetical protein QOK28_2705 [Actinomycetota bacterium]|jgi:hypothetical protein